VSLVVLYLMARGDCVSGLSVCSVSYGQRRLCLWIVCLSCILWPEVQTENPETQSPLAIRYRTNRQSRNTITSGHKIQNKRSVSYGQR
jgi:hypothetical protein